MLHRLPVEVLELIVLYLDAQDIDSLFSIDYFKERLGEGVLVLDVKAGESEDSEESLTDKKDAILCKMFPNLTKRCTLEELNNKSFRLKSFVCLVILADDIGSDELVQIKDLSICKKYCVPTIDDFTIYRDDFSFLERKNASMDTVCYLDVRSLDFRNSLDYLHRSILQFPMLEELTLKKISFIPSNLNLPLLIKLTLNQCESSNISSRWKLPKLKTLFVRGKFKTINSSIDYGNTTIEEMRLRSIKDMREWSGISNKSFKKVQVGVYIDQFTLQDMNFEAAAFFCFFTECTSASTVSNLKLPNVEHIELNLSSDERDSHSISSINAPKLLVLQIYNTRFALWEDIKFPSLEKLIIIDTRGPTDERFKTLAKSVKTLVCENTNWWKFNSDVENLTFSGDESNCRELESSQLNHLKSFTFSTPFYKNERADLTDYVYPDAPNLERLRIKNSPQYYPFDKLKRYKHLKTLSIFEDWGADGDVLGVSFKNLNFPNLTKLEIKLCFTDVVSIIDCYFPSLEILDVEREFEYDFYEIERSRGRDISQIEVEAPNLKSLSITGLTLGEHFIVSQYRKLKQLKIIGCAKLKSLTVLDSPLLDTFRLYSYDQVDLHHDGCLKDLQKNVEVHKVEQPDFDYGSETE